jgi:hypothetical protein
MEFGGTMRSFARLTGGIGAAVLAALTLGPASANAQVAAAGAIVPISCSPSALASAITAANTSVGTTTIQLPFSCTITIVTPATATDGLPVITGNVAIAGSQNDVIQRASIAPNFRIFEVAATGTLSLSSLSILNGNSAGLGGGILNAGDLSVSASKFSGNTASNGGAVSNSPGGTATISGTLMNQNTTTGVGGGAIINFASLFLSRSTVDSNSAPVNGGGLNTQPLAISRIAQTTFTNNVAGSLGGGISNLGSTYLNGSQVRLNSGSSGGGIASGNNNVFLTTTIVRDNTPDNCQPVFAGCS